MSAPKISLWIWFIISDIVQSGSQVILTCAYSVSPGEYIDSIKWYLNTSECYRIVPGLTQDRVLTFPPGGDCVSLPQSGILRPGTHRLVINNATQACSGKYICQITESRPPFKTEQAAAVLKVLGEIIVKSQDSCIFCNSRVQEKWKIFYWVSSNIAKIPMSI